MTLLGLVQFVQFVQIVQIVQFVQFVQIGRRLVPHPCHEMGAVLWANRAGTGLES